MFRFPSPNFNKEDVKKTFQLYEEVKRFFPKWKIRFLENLKDLEQKMIRKIQMKHFTGPEQYYPSPPIVKENWIEPSRKELFLESKTQHNCIFSYDSKILEGKYYIYRIFSPERCISYQPRSVFRSSSHRIQQRNKNGNS